MKKIEIAAGKFKAQCLALMDMVQKSGGEITITKRGKPVAKLVPVTAAEEPAAYGCMRGSVAILGDIVAPIDENWNAGQ